MPVEIAILDYNSSDDMRFVRDTGVAYHRYTGRQHYHLAHAYNMSVIFSTGEYVAIMGADALLSWNYIVEARKLIDDGCIWMRGPYYKGIIIIQRDEFMAAGGYDERFEFYGGEDKDLEARLVRRGGKFGLMPDKLVRTIKTPNRDKLVNYRLPLSKAEMIHQAHMILDKNNEKGILIANEGRGWGQP